MDRKEHIAWLRRELDKHPQPCQCPDCASARGELLFLGELLDGTDSTPGVAERAA